VSELDPDDTRSRVERDEGLRERLIVAGRLIPAAGSPDGVPVEPLPAVPGPPLSEVLLRMREEERR
jgi:hypothetical protein